MAQRNIRYSRCIEALQTLSLMSVRVVVDGGFLDSTLQRRVIASYSAHPKVLIRCHADQDTRMARLRTRASDTMDIEQVSAESIIKLRSVCAVEQEAQYVETPANLGCDAIIHVDTTWFKWHIVGSLDATLEEQMACALEQAFIDFRATDKSFANGDLNRNFAELAPLYEETTEWRSDATLLSQLRFELPRESCAVLDIGSGTGLAAQWYSERGHRCVGIDLSPQMSIRAAPRILFTNFGSALDLPFFDESFDLALMRQMLHYTEPALALKESFRVVLAGGVLIIAAAIAPSAETRALWEEFKNVTQPLRLRVFSEADLICLVEQAGFSLIEARHHSLVRSESFEQLERRATAPSSGWASFLSTMEQVFAKLAPQLQFMVTENSYSYRQYWVTLVAQKPFSN